MIHAIKYSTKIWLSSLLFSPVLFFYFFSPGTMETHYQDILNFAGLMIMFGFLYSIPNWILLVLCSVLAFMLKNEILIRIIVWIVAMLLTYTLFSLIGFTRDQSENTGLVLSYMITLTFGIFIYRIELTVVPKGDYLRNSFMKIKWFLKCVLVTFSSMQLVFIIVVLFQKNPNKGELFYLMLKGTQFGFVQFFLFFIVFDILLKKLSASNKFFSTFKAQLLLVFIWMMLVFSTLVLYDWIYEPDDMVTIESMRYLKSYYLFILFVPVAVILNYFISKKRNLTINQTTG